MSEVSNAKVSQSQYSVKSLNVVVVGKIVRVRRYDKFFYTTVVCPAKDEYSRPPVVEIRSKHSLGDVDDKINVACELVGYEGKAYQFVDRETGERRTMVPVNMYLELLSE